MEFRGSSYYIKFNIKFLPPSVLRTPKTSRNYSSRVTTLPEQIEEFNDFDKISDFSSIDGSLCPSSYQLQVDKTIFYKIENCKIFDIPLVTEAIVIGDNLRDKLFSSGGSLPPLPPV